MGGDLGRAWDSTQPSGRHGNRPTARNRSGDLPRWWGGSGRCQGSPHSAVAFWSAPRIVVRNGGGYSRARSFPLTHTHALSLSHLHTHTHTDFIHTYTHTHRYTHGTHTLIPLHSRILYQIQFGCNKRGLAATSCTFLLIRPRVNLMFFSLVGFFIFVVWLFNIFAGIIYAQ